ncbi:MAG: alginate export family protein [Deltaproteobacteria bacterium]|nr:alginate export family protein [Deltaproteobacteria bacterium]
MRYTRILFVIFVVALCWPVIVSGEARADAISDTLTGIRLGPGELDLGGSLRYRYEYQNNFSVQKYGTNQTDNVLLMRTRINVGYRLPQKARFFVQFQDARFALSDLKKDNFGPNCPYWNELDLRQAFFEWREIGNSPLGFKVGRQAIQYGDNRIFGPGGWGNVGRYTWDGGKILVQTPAVDVDIFTAQRILYQKDEFDDDHFPYKVYAAYGQIKSIPKNKLDLFYVVKWDSDETTKGKTGVGELLVQTVGFYGKGKWNRFDYASTFAYQFGDYGKDNINAFGLNAEVGYTPIDFWTPRFAVSLSYASGDKDPNDGTYGTFDGVFGAIDMYYGRMNLFSWMNLMDIQVGVSVKPVEKMKISLDYHNFSLAQKKDAWYYCTGKKMRWDPTGASGSDLGNEIDLVWQYQIHPRIGLMAGCAAFFPGDFVEATGSDDNAYWAFGQIMIKI